MNLYRILHRRVIAILLIISSFSAIRISSQINTDQVITVGRNAMYFEDYVLAIQYFNRAIKQKPYLAWPYFWRSIAKINLEDYEGAVADAGKTIELNPFITDAYEVRGVARQNLGDSRGAIEDYRLALEQIPDNRQLTYNMACALIDIEDYAKADSVFTRLLDRNPGFENGWLGRARLAQAQKDTAATETHLRKALSINPNSFNAHAMMADLEMRRGGDHLDSAIMHLDRAIRLEPKMAGLYVNRAYVKYCRNDWYGAMADFDNALDMEPDNKQARFNRGILEMEVSDYDHALRDFTSLLEADPTDVRSRYNRAVIYINQKAYKKALEDVNYVVEAFPTFPTGYSMRSQIYRAMGNTAMAASNYDRAMALSNKLKPDSKGNVKATGPQADREKAEKEMTEEELVKREFASLLTSDDNTDFRQEFNNSDIRGKVQDRNLNIDTEPMIELTYYSSPSELRSNSYYIKEVDELNATRSLRNKVLISSAVPVLTDEDLIDRHFKSIDYYNSYLATHKPRTVDYVGRAMDFITVRNYESAIRDLDRAIALSPDYSPAYMLRAQARAHTIDTPSAALTGGEAQAHSAASRDAMRHHAIDLVIADLDRVIALSPRNAFALYNKANMLIKQGNLSQAQELLNQAIELKPDFGEAYFNRGFVLLRSGSRASGVADLSKAGELGIVAAYNLIKRISNSNK